MPISSRNEDYADLYEKSELTEDAFDGSVKDYITKLAGETPAAYHARVNRPSYYNVTERTLLALIGALMRKPFQLENLATEEPHTDNDNFPEYIQSAYKELMLDGRIGIFVDFDEVAQSPKLITYCADNIINWCDEFIILEEEKTVRDIKDPYKLVSKTQWRELTYDENGYYIVRIWEETGKNRYKVVEQIEPLVRGKRLDFIPFYFVTPYDNSDEIYNPPLYNLAVLNIEHFKVSADYSHGLHFLALPTPWIAGDIYTMDGNQPTELTIGTEKFIHLTENSKVGFLEFQGSGLGAISSHLEKIEQRMFSMGSRLLQAKNGVESAEALSIRAGSESAVLETMTNALENGLQMALEVYNMWAGSSTTPTITLNKDFSAGILSPQEISALLALYTAGAITLETFLSRLYDGEIVTDVQAELAGVSKNVKAGQPV